MVIIRLQSSDGEVFETDERIAKCSGTIQTILQTCGIEEDAVVPLKEVRAAILRKVLQWANHHKDDLVADDDSKQTKANDISQWDKEFLNMDQGTLFDMILATNYLDAKALFVLLCETAAQIIKGKTPEQLCAVFNIRKDDAEEEDDDRCRIEETKVKRVKRVKKGPK